MALWPWIVGGLAAEKIDSDYRAHALSSGDSTQMVIHTIGALVGACLPWYFNYWGTDPAWGLEWWVCFLLMPVGAALGVYAAPVICVVIILELSCAVCF